MHKLVRILIGVVCITCLTFCSHHTQNGTSLSKADLDFIKGLGLLDDHETIILFDTQGGYNGVKTSGNFFTNKRISSYWLDDKNKSKTSIKFAYYPDIDTIIFNYNTSLTYSSFMTVKLKNGNEFNVYNDGDKSEAGNFFNQAMAEWTKNKK